MRNTCVLLFVLTIYACGSGPGQDSYVKKGPVIDPVAIERLDAALSSFIADSLVVGASALIFEEGEEAYFKAVGYADREAEVPMARNTIATIYSMTKPITGTTLMTLFDEGRFQLDDRLPDHLPEYRGMQVCIGVDESGDMELTRADREISIRDITRHTAGFSQREDLGLHVLHWQADLLSLDHSLAEMSKKLSEIPLGYQPGTRWEYGVSVDVQAYLAEKLAGKPFAELMRERVLDPLGMSETSYFVPKEKRDRVAAIYNKRRDGKLGRVPDDIHAINYREWPMTPGGWGLKSTIDDYMTFARMLLNKGTINGTTVLQPETVDLMATNHLPAVEDSLWLPGKGRVGFGIDFAVRTESPQSAEEN
ncbi:MAG: serine hydrolase domain-containing protein, partial [Bacteroidota bacterium]